MTTTDDSMIIPMSGRQWLVSQGLAKPGAGRPSRAMVEAIAAKEAEGYEFRPEADTKVKVVTPDGRRKPNPYEVTPPRPNGEYVFIGSDGKEYVKGQRTTCQCGRSFRWCLCADGPFDVSRTRGQENTYVACTEFRAYVSEDEVKGR